VRLSDLASEAVLIAGGGRAILLQIANPAVGHGVADHSDFASRPLDRLHATLTYVYAVACGTAEDIEIVRRRVNRAHAPVYGTGNPNSPAYANSPAYYAFDPELQLWVAATLYDSAMAVHQLVFGPHADSDADAVYGQYASLGTSLQMPADLWPPDKAAFNRYWQERIAELRTDAATRAVVRQLLYPRTGPLLLRAVMPLGRLVTVGLLPPPVRQAYGLSWNPTLQKRFERVFRFIAAVYPLLPRPVRHWPKNHYLRALRASAGRAPASGGGEAPHGN
jgi:uncharacterized protein (DUF2236 family)